MALVTSSFHPYVGGVEEHVRSVARELTERGHHVEVWTVDRGLGLGRRTHDGVAVEHLATPLPARSLSDVARFLRLVPGAAVAWWRAARRFRPDVLHVQCFGPNGVYATGLAAVLRCPLVVSSHGETFADDHGVFDKSVLIRSALRSALRRADAVTGCSIVVVDHLRAEFGLQGGDVVPNGVEITGPMDEEERVAVVGLGRLERVKGFDLLVEAFATADLPPEVGLVLAGSGSQAGSLHSQAASLGVATRVSMPGAIDRDQVKALLASAAVVVVPSRRESFGMVVLEAWLAGAALVVTDRDGPASLVLDGVTGLVVDPTDIDALARSIRRVIEDADLADAITEAGSRAVLDYSWSRVAELYEGLYAGCVGMNPVPLPDRREPVTW